MLTAILMFLNATDNLRAKVEFQKEMEISKQLEKALIILINSDIIEAMAALHVQVCSMHIFRNIVSELYQTYHSFS